MPYHPTGILQISQLPQQRLNFREKVDLLSSELQQSDQACIPLVLMWIG